MHDGALKTPADEHEGRAWKQVVSWVLFSLLITAPPTSIQIHKTALRPQRRNPFSGRVYTKIHFVPSLCRRSGSLWWHTRRWNLPVCPEEQHLDHMPASFPQSFGSRAASGTVRARRQRSCRNHNVQQARPVRVPRHCLLESRGRCCSFHWVIPHLEINHKGEGLTSPSKDGNFTHQFNLNAALGWLHGEQRTGFTASCSFIF